MRYLFLFLLVVYQPGVAHPIHLEEAVPIGGIPQWIKIDGANDQASVLLFIHGGPGNSVMTYADRFTTLLKEEFIVVLWDQRQSGKTATLSEPGPVSVELLVQDAVDIVQHLTKRFECDKIYVIGHSWGGYLALRVAVQIPEKLHACIAVSPMIHQLESERQSLQIMKEKARARGDQKRVDELSQVKIPFENAEQLYFHRKGLSKLMNSTAPGRDRVEKWSSPWLPVFNEAMNTNFFEFAPRLQCPVYFLIGRKDYQTYFKLTENYFQQVDCSEKKLYWFEQSAHNPHLTETTKFEQTVIGIKNLN